MSFNSLWPMILLLAIPGIIILYMLKQKGEDYKFSSVLLWEEFYKNFQANSPWDKLKNYLQMYLQIAIVSLIILALMTPFIRSNKVKEENIILVLDTSASMLMSSDGKSTRFDNQIKESIDYINSLSDPTITIIEANKEAKVLMANTKDKSKAKDILKSLECTNKSGNTNCAKDLISTFNGEKNSHIIVMTDESFDSGKLNATVINLYEEADNISIDYVSASIKDGEYTVIVKVTNHSKDTISTEINLYGDSNILNIKEVTIDANSSQICYFDKISFDGNYFKASINDKDALAKDNVAYHVCQSNGKNSILLYSKGNVFIEQGVEICAKVIVDKTSDFAALNNEYNLIIADANMNIDDEKKLDTNILLFAPSDNKELDIKVIDTRENAFIKLGNNELTEYLEGYSLGVNNVKLYEKPSWATELISFDGKCAGYYGIYNNRKICVLGFDLRDTDFALCVEYPIFLSNILGYMLDTNIVGQNNIQAGENVNLLIDMSSEKIKIESPNKTYELKPTANQITFSSTDFSGLYSIKEIGVEGRKELFYVSFPTDLESNGLSGGAIAISGENVVTNLSGSINLTKLIYIMALLLLLIETILYNKNKKGYLWFKAVIATLIILALFDVSFKTKIKDNTTIFVVDRSMSYNEDVEELENFIKQEIKNMPPDNKIAIVTFGKDALTEQYVSDEKIFSQFTTEPIESASNLENAILRALALFPDQGGKRLIIITDGKETDGNINNTVSSLTAEDISVGTIFTNKEQTSEVYITDVNLPERINVGDEVSIKVNVNSNIETNAKVSLFSGRDIIGTKDVFLNKGVNQFIFTDIGKENATQSYKVIVTPSDDTISINNEFVAYTQVEMHPKILVIEGTPKIADNLKMILESANYEYDVVSPQGVPDKIDELLEYKSIISVDVYYDDFKKGFVNIVDDYVGEYGGGFICIGGQNSYALGNYRDTVIEEILPVNVDLKGEQQIPKTCMVMVIDHSGSMSSPSSEDTKITGLDLAKQAAIGAVDSLRTIDEVGVISFDEEYTWTVSINGASDKESIKTKIKEIEYGGGTSIQPALSEAIEKISQSDAGIKHVVLLTDGQDYNNNYDDIIELAQNNNITISTVAVGFDADTKLLEKIANEADGRFYYSDVNANIPRIFAKEVFLSTKAYLINENFYPIITSNSKVVTTVYKDGWYELHGYIATTPKQYSSVLIKSHKDDPILVSWKYGLGNTVAWTSDISNGWTGNYVDDSEFVQLWSNIIDSTVFNSDINGDSVYVDNNNTNLITYLAKEYSEKTKVEGVYVDQEGNSITVDFTQKSPGEFVANVDLDEQGIYSFNIRKKEGEEIVNTLTTSVAIQYSKEYRGDISSQGYESFLQSVSGEKLTFEDSVWNIDVNNQTGARKIGFILAIVAFVLFLVYILISRLNFKINLRKRTKKTNEIESNEIKNTIKSEPINDNNSYDTDLKAHSINDNVITNNAMNDIKNKRPKNEATKKQIKVINKKEKNNTTQSLDTSMLLKKKNDRNLM